MRCRKCGMKLPGDSEFCQYCGARLVDNTTVLPRPMENAAPPILKLLVNNTVENIKRNTHITEQHISDLDYGLVPEKPVFTLLVDGAEDYLNGLVSEDNEELTWNREGSMSVTGVSGPVDIYSSRKKNGQPYKTLYVSIYGKTNSTTIPKGFSSKGPILSAPAKNVPETAAGTNMTAEASTDLKNKTTNEGNSTNTLKTETPVLPQQKEMLFEDAPNSIQENIPVLLEKVSLYNDPQTGNLVTQCAFRSLTKKSLLAMLIDVHCTDVWGNPTDSVEGFQYLDLRTSQGMVFGQDKKIPISNPATRFVEIEIKKVLFTDRSLAEAGLSKAVLPAQQPLLSFFGSETLTNEFVRETGINAKNTITEGGGYWRCTCSAINSDSDDNCYCCKANKLNLLALQNVELISENLEAYQKEVQEKAERERVEREEYIRQVEEKARLDREETERKRREAAARTAEVLRVKKLQHQKRVKWISITVAAIMLILLVAYAMIWHIIPSVRYKKANNELKNKHYDDAYERFLALENYKDSEKKAKDALYQKACSLMDSGHYTEAADVFLRVPDYKDSDEQIVYCKNQNSYLNAVALYNSGNYDEAAEAFRAISGFLDSEEKVKASLYEHATILSSEGNYAEAADVFSSISDYSDSAEQAYASTYLYATQKLNDGEYENAYNTFKSIEDYEDSGTLANESYYQLALQYLEEKEYEKAHSAFVRIYSYKDSIDMAKEATYCLANEYNKVKDYNKAILSLTSIKGYKDSDLLLKQTKYNYAKQLTKNGSFTEAINLYKSLGDYSDSETKLKETQYSYGNSKLIAKQYKEAISIFADLGNYKDSKEKIKEAKYGFVLSHKNNTNTTTYTYLQELKSEGYKDSKSIFTELYRWYIEVNCVNTDPDDYSTSVRSVDKYCDYLHFQFVLHGGTPGEEITLTHRVYYPDGSVYYSDWYWENIKDGYWFGAEWANGVYSDPNNGKSGTFTIKIYNKKTGENIGELSIRLT